MSDAAAEIQALRDLAQDYRSIIEELKGRGWIEEHQEPVGGLITSTELAPSKSAPGFIAIDFYIHPTPAGDADNTVTIQLLLMKTPDDNRIKILTAADVAQMGRKAALETFRATVIDYTTELEK
jgi:hypothetical protein